MGALIRGSGGSSKKSKTRAPIESPDSLRSRQYARVIDLLSEGEIDGLVDGLKSIYLNDTPIEAKDGTLNFFGVTIATRPGTQSQSHIPGFPAVEAETAVNTEITLLQPVIRTITNANADAVRVTVGIPGLSLQNLTTGDIGGTSVTIAIDVQANGGGWQPVRMSIIPYTLSRSGASASSGSLQILSASVGVEWVGTVPMHSYWWDVDQSVQYCGWALQYRPTSGGAWAQFAAGTFSGAPVFNTRLVPWGDGSSSESYWEAPTASASGSITLAEGSYEFRVVMVSGTGTLTLNSATGYGWTNTDTITGKTTSKYQRTYRVPLTGAGPWDIRVRRITADSTESNLRNDTWWDSYTEIIDSKLRYPNSAIVGVAIHADQFDAIPTRGFDIRGLRVRVPVNYDPITRVYTGVWDGTFKIAWTDNPAWCFYDMLVEGRYGLGDFIDATQVDKWSLYTIAQYCDEMVPNGFGGQEPRFTCNLYLQTREEAYKVIGAMASIFRGMVFWAGGAVVPVQDRPADPVALFTPANVIGGQFNYQGASAKARHTVALVAWNDPADMYRQKVEYVEDADGIARFGVIQTEIIAVGCVSRGQAHRIGRWLLYTERMEGETITFRAGLDGLAVAPGDIIKTTDPIRAGERMGGRLLEATPTALTLDAAVTLAGGKTYTLMAPLPDGTVESRAVATGAGTTDVLTVSPAFTAAPQAGAIWVLAANDLIPESWRVVSVAEIDATQAEITALAYRGDKYDAVERDLVLEPLPTSSLTTTPPRPLDVTVTESLYLVGPGIVGARVTVSWQGSTPFYELEWRVDEGNWQRVETTANSHDIQPAQPGQWEFRVVAINAIGRKSPPASAEREIYGLSAPPANVAGFGLAAVAGMAYLTWDASPDLDVQVGGRLLLRHTSDTAAEWDRAIPLGVEVPGTATSAVVPLLAGRYLAKWQDASGNYSPTATSIITNAPSIIALNYVASVDGHPDWTGAKDRTQYWPELGALMLASADDFDSAEDIDADDDIDYGGGVATSGSYAMGQVDLGSVQVARLAGLLDIAAIDLSDLWDSAELLDAADDVDGGMPAGIGAALWQRWTLDDPAGSPTWSDWAPVAIADIEARAWQFELRMVSPGGSYNLKVFAATAEVDMPDRVESADDIASGAGTYAHAFARPFMVPPALGITAQNMATGDYYEITGKTESGFDITFRNAGGSAISRTFDLIARAY